MKRPVKKKLTKIFVAAAMSGLLVAAMRPAARGAAELSPPGAGIAERGAAATRTAHPAIQIARAHDEDGPRNSKGSKHHKDKHNGNYGGSFFRPADAGYFHQCYGGADVSSLPPGLQKQVARTGHLPPGLEKHLERNGQLPPGLQKRMSPANPCVLEHVRPLPPNSRLYMLGRDSYLINYHTHKIIDVLRGAF